MDNRIIPFDADELELAFVARTPENEPFLFGDALPVTIPDFFMATAQTTQALSFNFTS